MKELAAVTLAIVASTGGAGKVAGLHIYAIGDKTAPQITSADLVRSSVISRVLYGHPELDFRLTNRGAAKFHRLTVLLAQRGARLHRLQRFAFAVDGRVYFRPSIDYRRTPKGLPGAALQFQTSSLASARRLAAALRTH